MLYFVANSGFHTILGKTRWESCNEKSVFCEAETIKYEGWNFNFDNAAVTFDTAHLQSSYFSQTLDVLPKVM